MNSSNPQAEPHEFRRLVFHERYQRRNHQRSSPARKRRQLITERLSRPGRHHKQKVAAVNGRSAHGFLVCPESRKSKGLLQQRSEHIRVGGNRQMNSACGVKKLQRIIRMLVPTLQQPVLSGLRAIPSTCVPPLAQQNQTSRHSNSQTRRTLWRRERVPTKGQE